MKPSTTWLVGLVVFSACTYDKSELAGPPKQGYDGAADHWMPGVDGNTAGADTPMGGGDVGPGTGGAGGAGEVATASYPDAGKLDSPIAGDGGGAGGVRGGSGTGGSGTGGSTDVVAGLVVYYKCDETTGSTLVDSSGNNRNGNLVTGTGGSGGYSFGTGKVNNALYLVKSSQGHATIPQGTLSGATEMTIATWVYVNTSANWQRVWDFGNNNIDVYMYLTPRNADGFLRFAITRTTNTGEQGMNDDAELPVKEWHHVAVVLGSGGGILYLDGVQHATNTGMSLRPADLGSLSNNYIGRSQWAGAPYLDPYFDGNVDDFRVYNRALSATEIQTLYNYRGS